MESEGRKFHSQSAQARETGHIAEALYRSDDAILAYDNDSDALGLAEVLSDRSITFRNTKSKNLLILAKHEVMAGIEIARNAENDNALALPIYNLAKIHEELGEIDSAVTNYKEAITHMEQTPPSMHNQQAILLDMKIRISIAEIKNGNQVSLDDIQNLIDQLQNEETLDQFTKDVWVSGAYMQLAEINTNSPDQAADYLSKARTIINNNPQLTERKKQLDALTK